jgi:hypothetical protein
LDADLRQYGIELIAPHRCNRRNKTQDLRRMRRYRRRWKIERLFAWLQNFRRFGRPLRTIANYADRGKVNPPYLQPAVRRPLSRLMTKTTNPTIRSKWIRPPPICRLKPRSHKIRRTARTVQSISTSYLRHTNMNLITSTGELFRANLLGMRPHYFCLCATSLASRRV